MFDERIAIIFQTTDGHTRLIAERIEQRLQLAGFAVDILAASEAPRDLTPYSAFVVGGPIRLGRFSHSLAHFVKAHRDQLSGKPSAFFSAGLMAAHADDTHQEQASAVTEKFLTGSGWRPDLVATFGGALPYTRYGFAMRHWMRFIVGRDGGDTDTSRDYDYTDWTAVGAFADHFAARVKASTSVAAIA